MILIVPHYLSSVWKCQGTRAGSNDSIYGKFKIVVPKAKIDFRKRSHSTLLTRRRTSVTKLKHPTVIGVSNPQVLFKNCFVRYVFDYKAECNPLG